MSLARLLGFATEEFACTVGETLGGLLNTTFGKVEAALENDQIRVLSNILLIFGSCFFFSRIAIKKSKLEQEFSSTAAKVRSSLVILSCITLGLLASSLAINDSSNINVNSQNRSFNSSNASNTLKNVDNVVDSVISRMPTLLVFSGEKNSEVLEYKFVFFRPDISRFALYASYCLALYLTFLFKRLLENLTCTSKILNNLIISLTLIIPESLVEDYKVKKKKKEQVEILDNIFTRIVTKIIQFIKLDNRIVNETDKKEEEIF
ncbi:6643_t:CDS:2 [Dentiscutata erythropus]|uniref:6643_t:CDS:1 n=1 Tax=Dentiscutata erythropus TaxID=1348616 RepID=A0A9N9HK03_9GLOM|nr:6643_t:CDS:2 [Dentiscutata erythropus]